MRIIWEGRVVSIVHLRGTVFIKRSIAHKDIDSCVMLGVSFAWNIIVLAHYDKSAVIWHGPCEFLYSAALIRVSFWFLFIMKSSCYPLSVWRATWFPTGGDSQKKWDAVLVFRHWLRISIHYNSLSYLFTEWQDVPRWKKKNPNVSGSSDPILQENSVSIRTEQSAVIYRGNIFIPWPFLDKCNISVHRDREGVNVDQRDA